MSLIDRIEAALDRGVDPDTWELTATALLQKKYPWLSPVESGADIGRDADLYNVIEGDPRSRGRLLATTSNVLANLKSSHATWQKAQARGEFRVDALVIATPNKMSATQRAHVETYCEVNELPLPQFYTRNWIIPELVESAAWREKLTGVKGRIDALKPVETLETDSALLGRDALLDEIAAQTESEADVLLVGLPGAGKTRLLPRLGESTYLIEPLGTPFLVEDLLALAPKVVALDDVQLYEDVLLQLTTIRAQEGLSFSIVAITWPHYEEEAALRLPGCKRLKVELLPRAIMDELVRSRGVQSMMARAVVLDQAEGRPGWAVMLCDSLVSQDGQRVVSGEILLERAMRTIRAVSDSQLTVDALALLAVLGGATLDDLHLIGTVQQRSGVEVVDAIRAVATSGLIELRYDRYKLLPLLRSPLIIQWFFSPDPTRSWAALSSSLPDRRESLVAAMLEAAISTEAPSARAAAWAWARDLPDPLSWSEPTFGLVRQFAQLTPETADWAARAARTVLAAPRRPIRTPWGTERDDVALAAEGILRSCVEKYFSEQAVHGLLDLALNDDGSRHSFEKEPLATLGQMAQLLHPDRGTLFEIRPMLTRFAGRWFDQRSGHPGPSAVYCDVIRRAFAPSVQGTWSDPGQFRTVMLTDGIESSSNLAKLTSLWPEVVEHLLRCAGPLPIAAASHLIRMVEDWLRVAAGRSRGSSSVTEAQKEQAQTGSWVILRSIAPLVGQHSGAVLKTWNVLDLADRWGIEMPPDLEFPLPDPDLSTFVARRLDHQSTEEWMEGQAGLAGRLASLGAAAGTSKFVQLVRVAREADLRSDGQFLALQLARAVSDPTPWVAEAIASGSYSLTYRMICEIRTRGLKLGLEKLRQGLSLPEVRGAVIGATLEGREMDEPARFIIDNLMKDDAESLERPFARESADDVLIWLLDHQILEIRVAAALAFDVTGDALGPPIPTGQSALWSKAFRDASLTAVQGHNRYRLREVLEHLTERDPQLCAEWFAERMREEAMRDGWRLDRLDDFENLIRSLPREQRANLVAITYSDPDTRWRYLPELIGADPELADELLTQHRIDPDDAVSGLSGERDNGARLLAPVLIRHGVAPGRVAQKINGGRSWMGDESAAVMSDVRWFEELREQEPELGEMCSIALDGLNQELKRVLEEERVEAIRGWS